MQNNPYAVGTFFSLTHYAVHKFRIPGQSVCDKRSGRTTASIYYITGGNVHFSTPQGDLTAKSGDVLYIPRRLRYTAKWNGDPDIAFYGIDFCFDIKSEFGVLAGTTSIHDKYPLQKLNKSVFDDANATFENLYQKYCDPENFGFSAVTDFYNTFSYLLERLDKTLSQTADSPVEIAAQYIEQHMTEEFYIDDLAKMCCLSPSRFYTLFRDYTGLTPVEYKNLVKIRASQKMLESGKTTEEICSTLSFGSASYFRKVFEQVTGMLPGTYRKNASGYGEKRVLL